MNGNEFTGEQTGDNFRCLCRWTGSAELLDTLLASLPIHPTPETPPQAPPDPQFSSNQPASTQSLLPSSVITALVRPPQQNIQWGMHKTQRLALLAIATLVQQQQYGLLLHIIRTGEGNKDGGLCQCLLELVDSVTRGQPGECNACTMWCIVMVAPSISMFSGGSITAATGKHVKAGVTIASMMTHVAVGGWVVHQYGRRYADSLH